jgi:hypothetical protein
MLVTWTAAVAVAVAILNRIPDDATFPQKITWT